jgi:hypothetical protein
MNARRWTTRSLLLAGGLAAASLCLPLLVLLARAGATGRPAPAAAHGGRLVPDYVGRAALRGRLSDGARVRLVSNGNVRMRRGTPACEAREWERHPRRAGRGAAHLERAPWTQAQEGRTSRRSPR